jgi:hypothetical protein
MEYSFRRSGISNPNCNAAENPSTFSEHDRVQPQNKDIGKCPLNPDFAIGMQNRPQQLMQ